MTREIKFRAKDQKGDWIYGHFAEVATIDDFIAPVIIDEGHQSFVNPETVGQFTGLCDKNGKEIYEGDIVRCKDYNEIAIGIIKYNQDRFIIDWKSKTDFNDVITVRLDRIEIIGNQFENPEPLEV